MPDTEPSPTTFPLKEFLGFTVERGDGRATATLELGEQHHNPFGVAHGAVAFTLMDTAMGAAVMSVLPEGERCATIEIQTRFLRGATTGTLSAEATVLSAGRSVVHLEARTVDDVGNLVAAAAGSFAVIRPRSG